LSSGFTRATTGTKNSWDTDGLSIYRTDEGEFMKMLHEEMYLWRDAVALLERRSRSAERMTFFNDWWWDLTPAD